MKIRLILYILTTLFICFAACKKNAPQEDATEQQKAPKLAVERSIQTIVAKDTIINGKRATLIPNNAINFTIDSAARKDFTQKQYTFYEENQDKENRDFVWTFNIKKYSFQQMQVNVIQTVGNMTLVKGIYVGDEIVVGMPLVNTRSQKE